MHPDLAVLVVLQRLDTAIEAARKTLTEIPQREAAVETRIADAVGHVDAAKHGVSENTVGRRAIEKDMAVVQGRLDRFKDQTMAVKTNKEFHALQHEITTAQEEIRRFEDRILELMVQADELGASVKAAEAALAAAKKEGGEERSRLAAEQARVSRELEAALAERESEGARLPRQVLALYESVRRGRGVALSAMRDGRCSVCQIGLRPMVAQVVRRNDEIVQCESCARILYYEPPPPAVQGAPPAGPDVPAI
jgi:hypothetical protein